LLKISGDTGHSAWWLDLLSRGGVSATRLFREEIPTMATAENGNTVRVHYTGKLDDGSVFDSSRERDPLELTLGKSEVIPGFEQMVKGMAPGESRTSTIPVDEAYGARRDNLILKVKPDQFPDHITPAVGQEMTLTQDNGQEVPVRITEVTDGLVTIDANHSLAGKDLTFEIELLEII
jgi:FKBP-type peptidyl-prolyl cis-trans isomerase 2